MHIKLRLIGLLEERKEGIHLRELSRLLKTGLPNVTRYAKLLEKENVIRRKKEANLVKLRLRNSPKTLAYLKQVNTERFLALPRKIQVAVTDFLEELEFRPLIALIFGSYAKETYTEDSDIDILLVFQELKHESRIENAAQRISMRTNTRISPVYLDYPDFEKNMLNREHDFSGEIRQNAIVLLGTELHYSLLWRFLA